MAMSFRDSGKAAPDYWREAIIASGDPDIQRYTESCWTAVSPWFVFFPAAKNTALKHNIRIAISDIALWVLQADKNEPDDISRAQWKNIASTPFPFWAGNYDFNLIDFIINSPNLSTDHTFHLYGFDPEMHPVQGGLDIDCINPDCSASNVIASFLQVKAWLPESIGDNEVLLSVGTDYYPEKSVRASDLTGVGYLPSAFGSRYQTVTTIPKYFYGANVVDPTKRDSKGNLFYEPNNPYIRAGGKTYITRDELLLNPPPQSS